jgi:serine/threonine protein kinase
MESNASFQSSVNAIDEFYPEISGEAEVLNRPGQPLGHITQTEFLDLLLELDVPVLGKGRNREAQDMLFIGQGASYSVTQPLTLVNKMDTGLLNNKQPKQKELGKLRDSNAFVTKRILPLSSQALDDGHQLAAITNEVRILSNESVRQSRCIVSLLGVAWDENSTTSRCWPRLFIEAATHGTFGDFIATNVHSQHWQVKTTLLYNVLEGLASLHASGIVHCDLKLENILVFATDQESPEASQGSYQAKLCDFGFALVQADYDANATICARLGTEPWNAPELMGTMNAKVSKLAKADLYSFGLLFARILLNGKSPFGILGLGKIAEIKKQA